nr:hypothetical protein BaRGS_027044 [Batillaria attramentaria]
MPRESQRVLKVKAIHNNFAIGNEEKMKRARDAGHWVLNDDLRCNSSKVAALKEVYHNTGLLSKYRCGYDVSFSEFVQYALKVPDPHWEPIYTRCDPCRFQPQLVVDMDTFARDSTIVLRRMGIESVLHELSGTSRRKWS